MNRNAVLAVVYAAMGLALTAYEFPQLRVVQILLPFTLGALAGVHLGRVWPGFRIGRGRVSSSNRSA